MSTPSPTSTSPYSSATQSGRNDNNSPTSSPLLFFVALGFGVVFTNLWIIVGVKYCFRYNRNRAARLAGDGEPIDMANMPRPHRRRREKKLMSMDDVNERFPLSKYKTWKSSREIRGLPAEGGIATAPQSRAVSMKDVEGVISSKEEHSSSPRPDTALDMAREDHATTASSPKRITSPRTSVDAQLALSNKDLERLSGEKPPTRTETAETGKDSPDAAVRERNDDSDDDDEDDPIRTAAAPEMLAEPGDTCAICIDTLEDDEDVRGLTCGHAFHASCIDPWLTARRACCPLCKADYYVPKPIIEGENATQITSGRRSGAGLRGPSSPQAVWNGSRNNPFSRNRVVITANPGASQDQHTDRFGRLGRPRQSAQSTPTSMTEMPQQTQSAQSQAGGNWRSRFVANRTEGPTFSNWFGRGRGNADGATATTPAQLEAGQRATG